MNKSSSRPLSEKIAIPRNRSVPTDLPPAVRDFATGSLRETGRTHTAGHLLTVRIPTNWSFELLL